MAAVLMRLSGSNWLSNSWKQELVITGEGVESEVIRGLKRIKMHLPYDRIAQVNLIRGVFAADLEVFNKGGAGNLIVKSLNKAEAEEAKNLIESKIESLLTVQSRTAFAPKAARRTGEASRAARSWNHYQCGVSNPEG